VEIWHADLTGGYDTQAPDWTLENIRYRGALVSDAAGWVRFRTTMPSSYPVPMDGPVGELMRATSRSPMRPAHLHFRVVHPGYSPLITHVFDADDPYLDDDAVFGVIGSAVSRFERSSILGAGLTLTHRLVLEPAA
jgi:hydroxyquinol 1,2-dioxygenase